MDFQQRLNQLKFASFMNENDKDYKDYQKYEQKFVEEKHINDESKYWMKSLEHRESKKNMLDYYKQSYD